MPCSALGASLWWRNFSAPPSPEGAQGLHRHRGALLIVRHCWGNSAGEGLPGGAEHLLCQELLSKSLIVQAGIAFRGTLLISQGLSQ